MDEAITLSVRDLSTSFFSEKGEVKAVDHVSFDVPHGSIVGLVGESGCGKSMTARSIMKLLKYPGKIVGGRYSWRAGTWRPSARLICPLSGGKR